MAFADDIANDYLIFDTGETVTLRQIRGDTGVSTVSVSNALSGPVTRQQTEAGNLSISGDERSWSMNAAQIGSIGVRVNDTITDASGETWLILSASLKTADTRWVCVCRREV